MTEISGMSVEKTFSTSGLEKLKSSTCFELGVDVSEIVSELVDKTCKNAFQENEQDSKLGAIEPLIYDTDSNKLESVSKEINLVDNDAPVRRSTRIRRSVVKDDAFVSSRQTGKKNKVLRNSDPMAKDDTTTAQNITPSPLIETVKSSSNLNSSNSELSLDVQTVELVVPSDVEKNDKMDQKLCKRTRASERNVSKSEKKLKKEPVSDTKKTKVDKKDKSEKKVVKSEKKDPKSEKKESVAEKKKSAPRKKKQEKPMSEVAVSFTVDDLTNENQIHIDDDAIEKPVEQELVLTADCSVFCEKISCSSINECKKVSEISNVVANDPVVDMNSKILDINSKPVKMKSRWWRSSELEGVLNTDSLNCALSAVGVPSESASNLIDVETKEEKDDSEVEVKSIDIQNTELNMEVDNEPNIMIKSEKENSLNVTSQVALEINCEKCDEPKENLKPIYDHIEENIYKFSRKKSKSKKEVRRMVCDCTLTKEELECGVLGCTEECLNRLLMIECGTRCLLGESCSNKKFQKKQYINAEIIHTDKKGFGLKTLQDISGGDFLMEFVGEVINHKEYRQRVKQYAKEKNVHCYFMALKTDEILDATNKGNYTRFINHSCDPNSETQKWTVNGELRVGVFSKRPIAAGEELTLDYKFQRYGREAQKCYCESILCSGFIGGTKQISIDAYSTNKPSISRKKKDEKKRDWEDKTLVDDIEKLNGSKGLRNREETLKLARLMVRADDNDSRHQLLDIIMKTEEQACLRLFLDYHGLPLLWSWMADIVDFDLKSKILQVLSLLPISNKTMLLDSKVLSVVEKWLQECSENKSDVSSVNLIPEEPSEPIMKKIKVIDFSDSETDSSGSHSALDNPTEIEVTSETSKTESLDVVNSETAVEAFTVDSAVDTSNAKSEALSDLDFKNLVPDSIKSSDQETELKNNISHLAQELLTNWKNLKVMFRIPRLEQQKRKEDELEADQNACEEKEPESKSVEVEQTGDHIQVLITEKPRSFVDNHRFDYENQKNPNLQEVPCKPILPKQQNLSKQARRNLFAKRMDEEASLRKAKLESTPEGESPATVPSLPNNMPTPYLQMYPSLLTKRPPLLPVPTPSGGFIEQPPGYPPAMNPGITPMPNIDPSSQLMYPPQMINSSQPPFIGTAPPSIPPPATILSHPPPVLQHPPPTVGLPPCQPITAPPPNIAIPPNPNNLLMPPNLPPTSVPTCTPPFMPNQTTTMASYPPGQNIFGNQGQPLYYLQQPTGIPNSLPVAPLPENPLLQAAPATTLQAPAAVPIVKEEPKPIKLPKSWRSAKDSEGNVYYYHSVTRETQWDPPSAEQAKEETEDEEEDSDSEKSDSSDTPIYDEPKASSVKYYKRKSKKRKTTKAAADTSVAFPVRPEVAKKIKELFRTKMSTLIVNCLNYYRKADCPVGRITNNEDFKYLARKLTHYTMTKELKQCKSVEDLECNETVQHKAKDFVKKYMAKYGPQYSRKDKCSPT